MDERRDLVDREELRRRIAEDPFSASEVWEMHLDAMPAVECPRGWTRDEVPVLRDALARAWMAEVYRTALGLACSDGWSDGKSAMASYIETAETHLAALSPADDSDIMPGSEFDGPVIL